MLPDTKKQVLLREIKQEVHNNPNKTYYGLYKDYSKCKGTICGQKDNIYIVVTSSITYVKQLRDNGYIICMQGDDKVFKE